MLRTLGNGPGQGSTSPSQSKWGWASGAEFSKPGPVCSPARRSAAREAAIWPPFTVMTKALSEAPSPMIGTPGRRRLHHTKTPIRT